MTATKTNKIHRATKLSKSEDIDNRNINNLSTKKEFERFLSTLESNTNRIVDQIPRIQAFDIYIISHSACPDYLRFTKENTKCQIPQF